MRRFGIKLVNCILILSLLGSSLTVQATGISGIKDKINDKKEEIADNQEGAVCWQEKGYMQYAGNAYKDMDECLNNCEVALINYQSNLEKRQTVSKRMQSLVDGKGAIRIAEHIFNC